MTSGSAAAPSSAAASSSSAAGITQCTIISSSSERIVAPARQVDDVLRREVAADLQIIDVEVQLVGNHVERDFDLDRVDHLLEDAAVADARRFAAELDRHFDRHLFAGPHAEQIDVQHLLEERVPLHVLQQRLAVGGAVEIDDLRAVAERGFELVGGERQADRFFAVTVEDGRQPARAAEPLVVPFTKGFAFFDV